MATTKKIKDYGIEGHERFEGDGSFSDPYIPHVYLSGTLNPESGAIEQLVNMPGHVCADNSSLTPLGIDGVFTGDWQDTLDYGVIIIGINADQNSATDGLVIQWSADGATVHDSDSFTILANIGKVFTFGPARRYVKLIYTNGGTGQSVFNLETSLRRYYVKPSSHRIQDNIVAEDDAELVKSVITGIRDDGIFGNATLDDENNIRVNSFPYTYSIAEGAISGHDALLKFGTRTSVAANTPSVVWEGNTALYAYMASAQQLKVSSASDEDIVTTGTGIRTLTIHGLDTNFNELTETVNMNGTTVVTTTNSFIRIFRAYGATCGTLNTNAGKITITNNAGTVEQLVINAGDGQTLMTLWTVPAGKIAYIIRISASSDTAKGGRISLFTRLNDGGILYPWLIKYRAYITGGENSFNFEIPFMVPAKTDIEIRINTPTSAGVTSAGSTFELWYENV